MEIEKIALALGLVISESHLLQEKAGISVFRVMIDDKSYVLKYFEDNENRREIANYQLLRQLGVPTIEVIQEWPQALLLEDINESPKYRLGEKEDLADVRVAERIAAWYRQLHQAGTGYLQGNSVGLYEEIVVVTPLNIEQTRIKTKTDANPYWSYLAEHLPELLAYYQSLPKTLNYNDFYFTNLVVAQDYSEALMFDYNLLGKGPAYNDLRNVTSSLTDSAKEAFLKSYGTFDQQEQRLDDCLAPLVTLIFASQQAALPNWANESLELLQSGELLSRTRQLLAD